MSSQFHSLPILRVTPDAAGAVAVTFAVPLPLRPAFDFQPGQFLTLRTKLDGVELRRSYSICTPRQHFEERGEIGVGIRQVEGGAFSRWAAESLKPGDALEAMPPEGRFTPRFSGAKCRVGFAAGSGITPLLSIIATTLESDAQSRFTLVYGNRHLGSIMFHEALQDLKDRYPARFTLMHLLSRQPQEIALFNGRLDEAKVSELLGTLLHVQDIDEAFICGPQGMIESAQNALLAAGMSADRVHCERFSSGTVQPRPGYLPVRSSAVPNTAAATGATPDAARTRLEIIIDGKPHSLSMGPADTVLDVALQAGLDLPYSCRGGVCCTCRARVIEGKVEMEKNFTLERWELDQGFVLTCQARALTPTLVVNFDER